MTSDPAPLAFAVATGGPPTPEQLAAITIALTPVAAVVPATAADDVGHHPAWRRAAMSEATGGRRWTEIANGASLPSTRWS